MAKIFISYSNKDEAFVRQLADALNSFGHEVLFDSVILAGGENWRQALALALRDSEVFIVLLTRNSIQSEYVLSEIGAARAYAEKSSEKLILPIVLDGLEIPKIVADLTALKAENRDSHEISVRVNRSVLVFEKTRVVIQSKGSNVIDKGGQRPVSEQGNSASGDGLTNVTWPGLILSLARSPKSIATILAAIIVVYLSARLAGYDLVPPILGKMGIDASQGSTEVGGVKGGAVGNMIVGDSTLAECIDSARRHARPYVIQSATMFIKSDLKNKGSDRVLWDSHRLSYTLIALEDLLINKPKFKEWYRVAQPRTFQKWYGSEVETQQGSPEVYDVEFGASEGEVRSIVTGINVERPYPLPLRFGAGNRMQLSATQDYQEYPNDEDVICEMTIVVESNSLAISPVGKAAKRYGSKSIEEYARFGHPDDGSLGPRTIVARWTNLEPGDEVGIHYQW